LQNATKVIILLLHKNLFDLSIVGFDNIPFAKLLSPPLTTIHQDLTKKGKRVMELLLHYFAPDNYISKIERHINLPVES
jgi:DNA-binding LacI/PurR family transcriptional regulator